MRAIIYIFRTKLNLNDEIKESRMVGACSMRRVDEKCV